MLALSRTLVHSDWLRAFFFLHSIPCMLSGTTQTSHTGQQSNVRCIRICQRRESARVVGDASAASSRALGGMRPASIRKSWRCSSGVCTVHDQRAGGAGRVRVLWLDTLQDRSLASRASHESMVNGGDGDVICFIIL